MSQHPTTNDFYYPYEQEASTPQRAQPAPDPGPGMARQLEEDPRYSQRQSRPPDRYIHQYQLHAPKHHKEGGDA